jgi:adenosylcobinamide kinase / adenosylcobinamide-phosphate guanylyltransferase
MENGIVIIFISGGARSGKSHFAEQTAISMYKGAKEENQTASLYYIATAKQSDDEMAERIRIHQQDRGNGWLTIEEPFDLERVLSSFKKEDVILIDCLTIWLSNVMFVREYRWEKAEMAVNRWLTLAREGHFHLLIVSNDVNEGIPFSDEMVLTYIYTLQLLHQTIVEQSELVVEVQAGIPTYWKGER